MPIVLWKDLFIRSTELKLNGRDFTSQLYLRLLINIIRDFTRLLHFVFRLRKKPVSCFSFLNSATWLVFARSMNFHLAVPCNSLALRKADRTKALL